jgi:protein involved in polysaccharide export with SLBB domain
MSDYVEPTPLEVFGSYVAYPLVKQVSTIDDTVVVDIAAALNGNDPALRQRAIDQLAAMSDADRQFVLDRLPLASAKSERLITLPTRGVFAEGKLGHCNISEEIDNTRFWDWQSSPIPIQAPNIGTIQPVTPTPQQQPGTTPTTFPSSLVNIVNPTAAPDPVGLAAALTLLGTPDIFRDMSGRQEVADLLKKLSDNTIDIAEAANRAREIGSKYGSPSASNGGSSSTSLGGARARPNEPSRAVRDLQDLRSELKSGVRDRMTTQPKAQESYEAAASQLMLASAVNIDDGDPLLNWPTATIVTGNVVNVEVRDSAGVVTDYSHEYPVEPNGNIRIPNIAPVTAQGLTLLQLRDAITQAFLTGAVFTAVTVNVRMTSKRVDYPVPISVNDNLHLRIMDIAGKNDNASGMYVVDNAGNINIPYLGLTQVRGQMLMTAQTSIETKLNGPFFANPVVNLTRVNLA